MTLHEKIKTIYPEIDDSCFFSMIILLKPSDQEAFISEWNHPTLPKPTQEQLDSIT
jgi:hypothetical protein